MADRRSRADSSSKADDRLHLYLEFRLGIPNVDGIEFFPHMKGFEGNGGASCGVLVFRQRHLGSVIRLYYN